ncbi:hypothetical protein BGX21_005959 [Mortierella sp. AD011]|nr:hypothetical protein BGX21_005959 [Mortierella sp. AD011]
MADSLSPWTIVGCNDSADLINGQTVLAYCSSTNPQVDCADLFVGGAINTLVTLPPTCGAPFGRIAKFDPTTTSQLPRSVLTNLGTSVQDVSVFVMQFDFEFQEIPQKTGQNDISFTIDISTPDLDPVNKRSDSSVQRFDKRWDLSDNKYRSTTKEFTKKLFEVNKKCKDFSLSLDATATGKFQGSISYGYHVSGTFLWIKDHTFYVKSDSSISASLSVNGLIKYVIPEMTVAVVPEVPIAGPSIPGIVNIGPYFKANLKFSGSVTVDGSFHVTTSATLPSVDFSIGADKPKTAALKGIESGGVKVTQNLDLSATLKMGIIPELGVSVKVMKFVDAKVAIVPYFGVDAHGEVSLNSGSSLPTKADACVRLNGHLALGYGLSGKLGPWGKDKKGEFWSYDKLLYKKCFNNTPPTPANTMTGTVSRRGLTEDWHGDETLWKRADPSTKIVCPRKRPNY